MQSLQAGHVAELVRRQGGLTADATCEAEDRDPHREWEREILGARLGVGAGSARLLCETSVALEERLPALAAALAAGAVSWQHVVNIVRETGELDHAQCGVVERHILADRRVTTPVQFRNRAKRLATELLPAAEETAEPTRRLRAENAADGGVEIFISLTADGGRIVSTCLDAMATRTDPADDRPIETRRADALVELCQERLDGGDLPRTPERRPAASDSDAAG